MINLASPKTVHQLLDQYHLAPNKRFGQNFLIDAAILNKIALAAQVENQPVLEIGPGLGSLTQQLALHADRVVCVEIDHGFLPVLHETLAGFDHVQIIQDDFLKTDLSMIFKALGSKPFAVCANLPYYITTPIIMRLLESDLPWTNMCFLLQKEVGERLAAVPKTKSYGSLTLAVQYYANVETICKVKPTCFIPQPNVESIVVRFTPNNRTKNLQDEQKIFSIIKAGFSMRRKTFTNNLLSAFPTLSRNEIQASLAQCSFSPDVRAEALSLDDFIQFASILPLDLQDMIHSSVKKP